MQIGKCSGSPVSETGDSVIIFGCLIRLFSVEKMSAWTHFPNIRYNLLFSCLTLAQVALEQLSSPLPSELPIL